MRTNVARHMYRRRDANRADESRIAIAVARFDAVAFAGARIDDDDDDDESAGGDLMGEICMRMGFVRWIRA